MFIGECRGGPLLTQDPPYWHTTASHQAPLLPNGYCAIALLGFLMLEGPDMPRSPIIRRTQAFRSQLFLETDIRPRRLRRYKPRLAQLARAPDCRLETLGCRQPSGGPRFKSGSADQHLAIPFLVGKPKRSRCLYLNHTQIGKASRLAPEVATWV